MALEVYNRVRGGRRLTLPGQATIDHSGYLRINVDDCRAAGLMDGAAIVMDHDAGRIGLRARRPGEYASSALTLGCRRPRSLSFHVKGALRLMGLSAPAVAGHYKIIRADGALLVAVRPALAAAMPAAVG